MAKKAKITRENYFQVKTHISYHDILNFQRCEFLYAQDREGKVKRVERDYFLYGSAFDAMITGEFPRRFVVGKDPKKGMEKLANERAKAETAAEKYREAKDKRGQAMLEKASKMIEEIRARENELAEDLGKESVSDTVAAHIEGSLAALKRQTLMDRFPRTNKTDQIIVTTKLQGTDVKGMLDYFHQENHIIADYKTTASMKNFNPRQYTGQMAWYRMLVRETYGIECDCYLIVADKETYVKHAYFYQFVPETLDEMEPELLATLDRMIGSIEAGIFEPSAFQGIRNCFTCDHYAECPFTIQSEPELV
jgi:hypothetical protein